MNLTNLSPPSHSVLPHFLNKRPRRNRKSPAIRNLIQETHLSAKDFVAPLFVVEGKAQKQTINSMPGVFRFSIDTLLKEIEELCQLGIEAINLFPYIPLERKDSKGSESIRDNNVLFTTIKEVKKRFPEICLMVDIALDPYTDHGHDGLVNDKGEIINDATLEILSQTSVMAAHAGADVVAPSDMMDGRIGHIRQALDKSGFTNVSILAYSAKYASAFYGPFREALNSAPKFGDKKTYQLNPANIREALLEAALDEQEGADILLIKPALAYLDVIAKIKERTHLPVAAYHVSGEYAMVQAAAQNGWLDADRVFHECLLSIKRAGADIILTYAAKQMAKYLKQ